MLDFNRLNLIEKAWEEIEASYRLDPYNEPLNRSEEYQKTLKAYNVGQAYSPQFFYKTPPAYPVEKIWDFLANLKPDQSPLEMIYYEKGQIELLTIQAVQTHQPDIITGSSCLTYGLPDYTLIKEAKLILADTVTIDISEQPENISAEEAAAWMQSVLRKVGIQNWDAIVHKPMNAKMSVNRLDKQVKIRKGSTFSESDLKRLIVHEIGAHVLRYENGIQSRIRLFQNSFPKYMETGEGLAVYNEQNAGLLQMQTLRKYAGRVIAAHLALSQSFGDVFQTIAADLGTEMAFDIVARAKRGFTDTAQPGAHTKDIIYLRGYLAVQAHLAQYPDDYSLLFAGKFGLQHLSLVHSLLTEGIISSPKLLPNDLTAIL